MAPIKGSTLEAVTCPVCSNFSSKRLTSFEKHLQECHNTTARELWVQIHGQPVCKCGCGQETVWIGWKAGFTSVRNGHNASIYAVYDKEEAERLSLTRGSNWRGKESHWKGKTKETDEATAKRGRATSKGRKEAIDSGEITIWSKGLTKETDDRLAAFSETQKEKFASGEQRPWSEGLTKETDRRVADMAIAVSITHKKKEIRDHLDSQKRLSKEETKNRIEKNGELTVVGTLDDYINDNVTNIYVKCKRCEKEFKSNLRRLQHGRCVFCHPSGSNGQAEVSRFVQSLGVEVINNCRSVITPLEIDIFAPAHNFGIEYNGLYTHNELSKSQIYHSNKTLQCLVKGIKLLHVFEDEWFEKQEIVKSMIAHRLGFSSRKIFARKCTIQKLTVKQRRDFFDSCHIDGDTNSSIAWGLFLGSELVSALSLRKAFHKKHEKCLEIARFCTSLNTSVTGGLAKLTQVALKHSLNEGFSDGLLTYVDTRFGQGEGYRAAGFKQEGRTPNRFWWTDTFVRFNRFKFRADKNAGLTEAQVAAEHGVIKIWGCPNLIFQMSSSSSTSTS